MCFADGHTVAENTGSLLTSEVKRHRARLVLGWGTAWEDLRVLSAFSLLLAAHVEHARGRPNAQLDMTVCAPDGLINSDA